MASLVWHGMPWWLVLDLCQEIVHVIVCFRTIDKFPERTADPFDQAAVRDSLKPFRLFPDAVRSKEYVVVLLTTTVAWLHIAVHVPY